MTTSTTTNKARYEGNGVTDTFAFNGRIFQTSDLTVSIITRATDALVETLTETTDYTVTINGDESASVTVVSGKIPSASQDIQLLRVLPKTQTLDLPSGTRFPAESVENSLDKITAIAQDLSEEVDRSIKLSSQSSLSGVVLPEPVSSEVIGWNNDANALTTFAFGDISTAIDTAFSGLAANDFFQYNGTTWTNITPTQVRTEIGLGTIATQAANNVAITGGTISGVGLSSLSSDLAIADGGTGAGTAAAAFANLKQAATTSATGVVELATAAEVKSQTASKVPTADVLFNHPGIAKAACKADGTGTPSFDWEYNFATITRSSTGVYDFTMDVTFASANDYAVVALGDTLAYARVENKTTTGFRITYQASGVTAADIDDINIVVFGNLV